MVQWSKDEVEELLRTKMQETASRLKAKGHKAGVDDLAFNLAPFVIALMSDARRRELRGILGDGLSDDVTIIENRINKRRKELKQMAEALWRFAEKQR